MFDELKFQEKKIYSDGKIYRGEVPFLLKKLKGATVYIASSKKNLNDYYWLLKDFYQGEILKQGEPSDEDYLKFSYQLQECVKNASNFIVLVTLDYFLKGYRYKGDSVSLVLGEEMPQREIIDILEKEGYTRNYLVEKVGEYSQRGDILDFFPRNSDKPLRVEFFHNEIDRIAFFNLDTQKTIEKIQSFNMYINSNKRDAETFLEMFKDEENKGKTETKTSKREVNLILENYEILKYKLQEILQNNADDQDNIIQRFEKGIVNFNRLEHQRLKQDDIEKFQSISEIKKISQNKKIYIYSDESKRYQELLQDAENIKFYNYPLYEGFENNGVVYLSDRELKGIRVRRDGREREILKRKTDLNEIKPGDYVIHENFGIGIYQGLKVINSCEYLELKYADQDRLFISTMNLDRIEKYIVEHGKEPEIYKLGKRGFRKRREKLIEEIAEFAKEIVAVQAQRMTNKGFKFSKDTILQEEFEESFPYTLTPDQGHAVEDVKIDMESGKVMDRIICGDVGCGKTEVAIRAAFKAVNDGKQVAFMAPTTVLAQQHYDRVNERLKNYPFTVELLSRVKTAKEVDDLGRRIANGSVDIIIGTHKILSDGLKFKDLALVIIDEEQKFGVKAKEKLKSLKADVDMLTLTATPIPRTLNLALLGIRDISIIATLPPNRLPIKDYYIENNPEDLKDAILKEFTREGQVYYLYNSVKKMERKEAELRSILPQFVKITTIHGQMQPREIKNRLNSFENGDIDILLTTTIIENGIDIENANTIIIEGLEKLGLSQLYQLRGRVGRGAEQGYCYILTDSNRTFKKKAKDREESMRSLEGVDSGGGLHLSLEDMRIRGAGEILGDKQHGAINTLGYSLYMKLLHDEIDKIKGEYIEDIPQLEIELKGNGYIPKEYIDEKERFKIYKRVAQSKQEKDIDEIENELVDRFGKIPEEAIKYLQKEHIRIIATIERFLKVQEQDNGVYIKFIPEDIKIEKIIALIKEKNVKYIKDENAIIYPGTIEEFFDYYRN